jgi:hypothetical protein
MIRHLLCFALLAAPPSALAQAPLPAALARELGPAFRLQRVLILQKPTVLILVDPSLRANPLEAATKIPALADSLLAALSGPAARFGYVVEVRTIAYDGLIDPGSNAVYRASPGRGEGLLLIQPGRRPSRLQAWPTAETLPGAIREYEQRFLPLQPL